MSSRLKAPAGSKLARPVPTGTGLKAPATGLKQSGGVTRPSPQPSGAVYDREGPPMTRTTPVGGVRKPAGQPSRPAAVGQGQQNRMLTTNSVNRPQPQPSPTQSNSSIGAQPNGAVTSFRVGDRVLVGGVKPGVIAFLGSTQFAKGVWAGIILDSFDGKNNGSVAGVQYFDCKPNRGLFSKPEKLKLEPKPRVTVPADKGPESTGANYKVGDKVLVDGVKSGVIGFIGQTQFAHGIWVGVILDTPEGKNAGSVGGVQYFECAPNHGLFTRPQKLSLIDSKPSSVQQRPNIPPSQQALPPPASRGSSQGSSGSQPVGVSQLKALRDKLKIGDHVLVGGVKEGILRFLGPTEFAKGIWAGVELPEPLGKNDGAVSGKRWVNSESLAWVLLPIQLCTLLLLHCISNPVLAFHSTLPRTVQGYVKLT